MQESDTEVPSVEAPSHPAPTEVFLQSVTSQINKENVYNIVEAQIHMLSRFEKTNEMLLNFNSLSSARYDATCREFKKHTQLLVDMKKDLDVVFKKIRELKLKLGKHHPEAFNAVSDVYNLLEEDEEGEESSQRENEENGASSSEPVTPRVIVTDNSVFEPPTPTADGNKELVAPSTKDVVQ